MLMKRTIALQSFSLNNLDLIGYAVGIRPLRKSGIRLVREQQGLKTIVHSYGHKGSGWTLSWGSALKAFSLVEYDLDRAQPVAVIGAGAQGLTMAVLLAERGYIVHLYADKVGLLSNSAAAGGMWCPGIFLERAEGVGEQLFYRQLMVDSYRKFMQIIQEKKWEGLVYIDRYSLGSVANSLHTANEILSLYDTRCSVNFGDTAYHNVLKTVSLTIDVPVYIRSLLAYLHKQSVIFTNCHFGSLAELHAIPEEIIINCTGIGSKELFADAELRPVKGQIMRYGLSSAVNYALDGYNGKAKSGFYLKPRSNDFVIGSTAEVDKSDPSVDTGPLLDIMDNVNQFFEPSRMEGYPRPLTALI